VPYYYAFGNEFFSNIALANPEIINVTILANLTKIFALSGVIDPTSHMLEDRVFIYNGVNDTNVLPGHTFFIRFYNMSSVFFCIVNKKLKYNKV